MSEKQEVQSILTPVGRLINASLFEKDVYTDEKGNEGKPAYKVEVAFDPKDVLLPENATDDDPLTLEDHVINAAVEKWGDKAEQDYFDKNVVSPLLDGDKLARRREEKGKEGDAYKGKIVVRANTIYNKHGQDAPGGIQVFDENVNEVGPANADAIYPGCMVQLAVSVSTYTDGRGDPAVKFYLEAVQKVADGERLVTPKDRSSLFKPVGRDNKAANDSGGGRRRRAG